MKTIKIPHLFLAPFYLELSVPDLLLERGNHGQVVEGDVVVVVLDLIEGLLVALLDVVYLVVLPLLHVAHLSPRLQGQIRPKGKEKAKHFHQLYLTDLLIQRLHDFAQVNFLFLTQLFEENFFLSVFAQSYYTVRTVLSICTSLQR